MFIYLESWLVYILNVS